MLRLAVLPGIILFFHVWRHDRIEKEPPFLLLKLVLLGGLTTISAIIIGLLGKTVVLSSLNEESILYALVDNFIITALIEEGGKYFVLKKTTWKHPAFNYTFDAVVYAVSVSLGFAIVENILYVMDGGIAVAIARALLSVPGHAIFAVFMGFYYGAAKYTQAIGSEKESKTNLKKALIVPVLLHGFYDFCLSVGYNILIGCFIVFEIVITIRAVKMLGRLSREDTAVFVEEQGEKPV